MWCACIAIVPKGVRYLLSLGVVQLTFYRQIMIRIFPFGCSALWCASFVALPLFCRKCVATGGGDGGDDLGR